MKPLPMWPLIIPTILILGIIGYAVVDYYKKEKKKGTWTEYDGYIAILVGFMMLFPLMFILLAIF